MPRLPADAFDRFLALGPTRSYSKLAAALGCSKRSVTARAAAEGWQAKLAQIDEKARRRTEERAVEDVATIDGKHLRMARAIQARALTALQSAPLGNGAAAVKALDVAIKIERTILGRDQQAPAGTHTWSSIVASVAAAAEQRRAAQQAQEESAPPPPAPEPVVPPSLAPRIYGEN